MAKKRRSHFCQNQGALWIPQCEGFQVATVTVQIDPAFICRDSGNLRLCLRCALRLKEEAERAGYEVKVQ